MTLGILPRSPLFKARKGALPKVGVLKRKLHQFHENSASDLDILGCREPKGRGRIEPPLRSLPLELSQLAARHPIGIGLGPALTSAPLCFCWCQAGGTHPVSPSSAPPLCPPSSIPRDLAGSKGSRQRS